MDRHAHAHSCPPCVATLTCMLTCMLTCEAAEKHPPPTPNADLHPNSQHSKHRHQQASSCPSDSRAWHAAADFVRAAMPTHDTHTRTHAHTHTPHPITDQQTQTDPQTQTETHSTAQTSTQQQDHPRMHRQAGKVGASGGGEDGTEEGGRERGMWTGNATEDFAGSHVAVRLENALCDGPALGQHVHVVEPSVLERLRGQKAPGRRMEDEGG
eukprot:1286734-Rhodomonas_salina.1